MLKSAILLFTEPICPCVDGDKPVAYTYEMTGYSGNNNGSMAPSRVGMTVTCPKCKTTLNIPQGQLKLQFLYERTTITPEGPKESPMARRMDLIEGE